MRSSIPLLLLFCIACSDGEHSNVRLDAGRVDSSVAACSAGESMALTLTTDDGVSLIADLYVAQDRQAPAVILLHMIPPSNSKANYPTDFAHAIAARGITVLNLNRRGAPGSGGVATDAYQGDSGKLDAKAAYDFLKMQCGSRSYQLMGASNGTTTVVDFAIFAAESGGIDAPAAIIGLSGGSYTENQHTISDKISSLPSAALFAYPTSEAPWNESIAPLNTNWEFHSYSPGAHGTNLLATNPEIVDTLLTFLVLHAGLTQ